MQISWPRDDILIRFGKRYKFESAKGKNRNTVQLDSPILTSYYYKNKLRGILKTKPRVRRQQNCEPEFNRTELNKPSSI